MKIILASKSPRRIEILRAHGIDPVIMPSDADESIEPGTGMREACEMLSRRKALACSDKIRDSKEYPGYVIIGADTVVWKGGIMGKPEDRGDAFRMLDKIRGTHHYVATGVTLIDTETGNIRTFSDVTKVYCKDYSDDDISSYLDTDEPYDKAGSYAIQGIFGKYIDHIEGDYENVVGLPYYRIKEILAELKLQR